MEKVDRVFHVMQHEGEQHGVECLVAEGEPLSIEECEGPAMHRSQHDVAADHVARELLREQL
jgi:hypothetical protein